MTDNFQLVLVGSRFPQLALGTLMSKRGSRVAIIEQGGPPGPASDDLPSEYTFRRRPSPLFGLDSRGLLRRFLDEIGIGRRLVQKSYPGNPVSYQVVLPRNRISVHTNRERYFGELSREFPHHAEELRTLYGELDSVAQSWYRSYSDLSVLEKPALPVKGLGEKAEGIWRSRKVEGLIKEANGQGPFSQFMAVQHHLLGCHPMETSPSGLSAALIHSIGARGTFQEPVGTSSLTSLIATRFQEFGGEIITGARTARIEGSGRNGFVLHMDNGPQIRTQCLATTADIGEARKN